MPVAFALVVLVRFEERALQQQALFEGDDPVEPLEITCRYLQV